MPSQIRYVKWRIDAEERARIHVAFEKLRNKCACTAGKLPSALVSEGSRKLGASSFNRVNNAEKENRR